MCVFVLVLVGLEAVAAGLVKVISVAPTVFGQVISGSGRPKSIFCISTYASAVGPAPVHFHGVRAHTLNRIRDRYLAFLFKAKFILRRLQ